jgi:hypothetical protein
VHKSIEELRNSIDEGISVAVCGSAGMYFFMSMDVFRFSCLGTAWIRANYVTGRRF